MAIPTTEVRPGPVLKLDTNDYWLVTERDHITPGNWRGFVQFKLKNLANNSIVQRRMRADEKVEVVYLDKKDCEYLYRETDHHVFMDLSTYDQYELAADVVDPVVPYMTHNMQVTVTFLEGRPVSVDLPASVTLKVAETEAAIKGNTATDVKKRAKLETGLTVMVPHFIQSGETVKVDTRTGEFISRA